MSGVADLPLHGGHVPRWLAEIMKRMARAVAEVVIVEHGTEGFLKRLADPYWFQAFNNVIGMDWDSSGSTTVTLGILKTVLDPEEHGIAILGGKGARARAVSRELEETAERLGLGTKTTELLETVSRLGAKVDSALLQDGYSIYHHALVVDERGRWVIVQQGMNPEAKMARRYHIAWYISDDVTLEPHSGVASDERGEPLNLTHRESVGARRVVVDVVSEGVRRMERMIAEVNAILKGMRPLFGPPPPRAPRPKLPYYRPIKMTPRLLKALKKAYEARPSSVPELLLTKGVGPEVVRALSLVAELIYREPPSLHDPVTAPINPFKYAFAVGGKDGIPYPVRRDLARVVIEELREVVERARLGDRERLRALRRLASLAPPDPAEALKLRRGRSPNP